MDVPREKEEQMCRQPSMIQIISFAINSCMVLNCVLVTYQMLTTEVIIRMLFNQNRLLTYSSKTHYMKTSKRHRRY